MLVVLKHSDQERVNLRSPVGRLENPGSGTPLLLGSIHIIADIKSQSQFLYLTSRTVFHGHDQSANTDLQLAV